MFFVSHGFNATDLPVCIEPGPAVVTWKVQAYSLLACYLITLTFFLECVVISALLNGEGSGEAWMELRLRL